MKHFSLTSETDFKCVRWPPKWYFFDPSVYEPVMSAITNVSELRITNTELRKWSDLELSAAWVSYTTDMEVEGMPVPQYEDQDQFFSAYLYAKQELGFSGCKLDELDNLWAR